MSDISKRISTFYMLGRMYQEMCEHNEKVKQVKSYNANEIQKAKEKGHEAVQKLKEKLDI